MLTLLLILLVVGAALTVLLWAGTVFLQGYYYTEPTAGVAWQAPAAGAALTVFLALWCLLVANSSTATTQDVPYDTLFRFSPEVEMSKEPVRELWAVRKGAKEPVRYVRKRDAQGRFEYRDTTLAAGPWKSGGVQAILVPGEGGEKVRFDPLPASEGTYRQFRDESGWVMREYDTGPTGTPTKFRWGRFLMNLLLNFFHLGLWFVCLWLLLRFQWAHALGLAVVLWLVLTLAVLPMLLTQAAQVAQEQRGAGGGPPQKALAPVPGVPMVHG